MASHCCKKVVNQFLNIDVGDVVVGHDPRMSPEVLKEHGGDLRPARIEGGTW